MVINVLLAGLGGFFGAGARFCLVSVFKFSWVGILTANVLGSFLAGLLIGLPLPMKSKIIFVTGFLGAFTTFSAFSAETVLFLKSGDFALAAANVFLSVFLCITGAALGLFCSNYFMKQVF